MDAQLPLVAGPGSPPRQPVSKRPLLLAAGSALVLVLLALAAWRVLVVGSLLPPAATAVETVVVPAVATDGLVSFTIPAGAAEAQFAGGEPYLMPDTMRLAVGDKLVVRNDDAYPHMIFSMVVEPGQTGTLEFDEPGVEAYSSGCTANGGSMNRFTSVIVSERRA